MLLESGYNIATLLSMYGSNTDWRDPTTWSCNNNVHASRHGARFRGTHTHTRCKNTPTNHPGSYDGIDMHPFETLFVKTSWHVVCMGGVVGMQHRHPSPPVG